MAFNKVYLFILICIISEYGNAFFIPAASKCAHKDCSSPGVHSSSPSPQEHISPPAHYQGIKYPEISTYKNCQSTLFIPPQTLLSQESVVSPTTPMVFQPLSSSFSFLTCSSWSSHSGSWQILFQFHHK